MAFAELVDGFPAGRLWAVQRGAVVRGPGKRSGLLQPGGRYVLRPLNDSERYQARPIRVSIATGTALRLPGPAAWEPPLMSPNGRFLAFGRAVDSGGAFNFLQVLALPTGRPVLTIDGYSATVAWSADGRLLVSGDRITVYDRAVRRVLVSRALAPGSYGLHAVWSPDGRRILVGVRSTAGTLTGYQVLDAATLGVLWTFPAPAVQPGIEWRPLGWVSSDRVLWARQLSDRTGTRDTALRWTNTRGRGIGSVMPVLAPAPVRASYAPVT
jgi:WD40 repeat protein